MSDFMIGDAVRVAMPRGVSKRGIPGISVLYTTWPEARFDGATGTIVEINARSVRAFSRAALMQTCTDVELLTIRQTSVTVDP